MKQQSYDLDSLSTVFKKLNQDKKKSAFKALQFILELNKNVGFDQILIRQGFQDYSKKDEIQNKKNFETYRDFFIYMKTNLQIIQSKYLSDSNDKELIQKAQQQSNQEYNYLLNKNSISKFIRDQAGHYQNVFDKYSQNIEEEVGVKSSSLYKFFIELFDNKYTTVIKNSQPYLVQDLSIIEKELNKVVIQYAIKIKQLTNNEAQQEYLIGQQQILDFLTFWLRQNSKNDLFVLYARTKQRLSRQSTLLTTCFGKKIHPSRMTNQQIQQKQIQMIKQAEMMQKLKQQQNQALSLRQTYKVSSFKTLKQSNNKQQQIQQLKLTKIPQLKKLFAFGCKRRYKINKNNTFDQLQKQLKTMNLQKFMYFCTFFQLTSIIKTETIITYFKNNALNLITLDYQRFQNLLNQLNKLDRRIFQNLRNAHKFQKQYKQLKLLHSRDKSSILSNYRFNIRPVNGKDVSTIQIELNNLKMQKQLQKEQKNKRSYQKRQQFQNIQKIKRDKSNLMPLRLSPRNLQLVRDKTFNPQKLIKNNEQDDFLWQAYQNKIWRKDNHTNNILESILSKRINQGNAIIKKINSQRSILYQ